MMRLTAFALAMILGPDIACAAPPPCQNDAEMLAARIAELPEDQVERPVLTRSLERALRSCERGQDRVYRAKTQVVRDMLRNLESADGARD